MSMIQNTEGKQPSDFLAMPFIGALNGFSDLSYSISESKSKFKRFVDIKVWVACERASKATSQILISLQF